MEKLPLVLLQQQMISYLTDHKMDISENIVKQGNITCEVRLNIYKNAYFQRLKEVIDNDHQMLGLYLGDDLFDQMVEGYVEKYPSSYTSLRNYADSLPLFLSKQAPFSEHLILSEIAHFERLLLTSFDAADTERFTLIHLHKISDHKWPQLVFRFHPSVQLAHFKWNSVESWQALRSEKTPEPAKKENSTWLLWRNSERLTEFRSLSLEEFTLIEMILAGQDFSTLCEYLLTSSENEEVNSLMLNYLAAWIEQGLFRVM